MSLVATLAFLGPLVIKMSMSITAKNFCQYLALCNFVAFNFGFHVHEKAMLLVTIPLGLIVLKSKENKQILRFKLLKLVMMWTLLPLIYTPRETFLKHAIFALDVILTDYFLPDRPE